MKAIRWGGLAGFLVFALILLVIGFFFIDNWLKTGLEAGGTRVNGAEVNVDDVTLTLHPLGFEVTGVQVTNAGDPSRNLFEIDDARLLMNLPRLFLGKVTIDDLIVDGMRADTARDKPGRVLEKTEIDETGPGIGEKLRGVTEERMTAIGEQLPAADQAARDALTQTREEASAAETALNQSLDQVQSAVARLPDQAALDDYDRRIENLRRRDIGSLPQLRTLQADIEALQTEVMADQAAIVTARRSANEALRTARDAVEDVTAAPGRDWAALREAYPMNQATAVKAGRLLLGDAIFDRVDQLQTYYRRVSPWLSRLAPEPVENGEIGAQRIDGRFVRFSHPNPSPDFLLDNGLVGFEADGWPWSLTVHDVTGQQKMTDKPVTLRLARGSEGAEGLLISGNLDRRGEHKVDRFEVTGRDLGWAARQVTLMDADLDWTPGRVDLGGNVVVTGENLEGRLTLNFGGTEFVSQGSGQIARLLTRALTDIKDFEVSVLISGRVAAPKIELSSDLDQRLNNALSAVLREEYNRWLTQAKAALDAEVAQIREPLEAKLDRVRSRRDDVEQRAQAFQQQVIDRLEALKKEVEAKRKKLSDQLEKERRKAEQSGKDAAKEALDDLKLPGF